MALILASSSPRRQELIGRLTDKFTVCPASIDEAPVKYQTPADYALSMAKGKARQISMHCPDLVLGADTVVCLGAKIFGKPLDMEDNAAMLRELAGRWHGVITGIALYKEGALLGSNLVTTRVRFTQMCALEIADYVASKEGLDKAGGYGIQGKAGKYIAEIDGCYYNVVGLPVAAVAALIGCHI